jgi:hypothetical protein
MRRRAGFAGLVGLTTLAAMAVTNARVLSSDTFYSLYAGRLIAGHGLPRVDTFTVAGHGRPWIDQQWLAHLAFFEVWRLGGYALVGLLSATLIGIAFGGFAYFLLEIGTSPVRTSLWSIVAFFVCQPNTATRAQSFAYPLFVFVLCIILYDDRRKAPGWIIAAAIPVLIVWANLHGSVMLAAPLVAGYCATRVIKFVRAREARVAWRYALLAVLAALAPLATPYGGRIVSYYTSVLSNPTLKTASAEWHTTTLSASNLQFILLVVLLVALGGMAVRRGYRPSPVLFAFTLLLAAGAIDSVRNQCWFAFPAVVFVTNALTTAPAPSDTPGKTARPERTVRQPTVRRLAAVTTTAVAALAGFALLAFHGPATERVQILLFFIAVLLATVAFTSTIQAPLARLLQRILGVAVVAATVAAAAALFTTTGAQFNNFTPEQAIAHATPYLLAHPHTHVLADDFASGPMLWQTPKLAGRVAFDPRDEIYPQKKLSQYVAFVVGSPGWRRSLNGYDMVVVSLFQNPSLATRMSKTTGWTTLYRDSRGAVYVRTPRNA